MFRSLAVLALLAGVGCGGTLTADQIRGDLPVAPKTRLMLAAGAGDVNTVQQALEQGEDINAKTDDLFTALHYAAVNGQGEVVALLIERGADREAQTDFMYTPLHLAVLKGDTAVAAQLAAPGANLDLKDLFGQTALHHAALRGDAPTVLVLLQAGATVVEATDDPGDLQATAAALRALAKLRAAQANLAAARDALEQAAATYDRADKGFVSLQERAESEL